MPMLWRYRDRWLIAPEQTSSWFSGSELELEREKLSGNYG